MAKTYLSEDERLFLTNIEIEVKNEPVPTGQENKGVQLLRKFIADVVLYREFEASKITYIVVICAIVLILSVGSFFLGRHLKTCA
jgi:hypothetical protein